MNRGSRLFIYPTRYCSADGLGPLPPQPAQRQESRPRSGGIKRPGIDGFNGQLRAGGLSGQLDAHRVARGDRAWAAVHRRRPIRAGSFAGSFGISPDQRTEPIWPLFPASPPILPLRPHKLFQKGVPRHPERFQAPDARAGQLRLPNGIHLRYLGAAMTDRNMAPNCKREQYCFRPVRIHVLVSVHINLRRTNIHT